MGCQKCNYSSLIAPHSPISVDGERESSKMPLNQKYLHSNLTLVPTLLPCQSIIDHFEYVTMAGQWTNNHLKWTQNSSNDANRFEEHDKIINVGESTHIAGGIVEEDHETFLITHTTRFNS